MDNVTWVPGWEGLYSVTREGKVWSHHAPLRRLLKLKLVGELRNQVQVALHRSNQGKRYYVHTLVALAFIGPRPEGAVILHLNGDPLDNRLENLRYGTRREVNQGITAHGRWRSHNALKQECVHGHPYDEANTRLSPNGRYRNCRACSKDASAQRRIAMAGPRKRNNARMRCDECGMITSSGSPMASHLRAYGHSGATRQKEASDGVVAGP